MDFADTLESYLVPSEEAFFRPDIEEDSIELLSEKKPLLIFSKYPDVSLLKKRLTTLMRQYKFSKLLKVNGGSLFNDENDNVCEDARIKDLIHKLSDKLNAEKVNFNDGCELMLTLLQSLSKQTNTLILVYFTNFRLYSMAAFREYPIIMTDPAAIKKAIINFKEAKGLMKWESEIYKTNFNPKIPGSMFVGLPKEYTLYHISKDDKLKELTPRRTTKPLNDENMRIPRISAAPTLNGCAAALFNTNPEEVKYYVYKLNITNQRIAKPTPNYVPDVGRTNEYWVLDPVTVTQMGYITIRYIPETRSIRINAEHSKVPLSTSI